MNNTGNASQSQGGGRTARTGVWFVGARGSVATTAVAGCAAVTAAALRATTKVRSSWSPPPALYPAA